jgi:hypothetical protein
MLILAVAANTSFADFPRVSAILAGDGFLPRQFTGLGDRLVFANGILSLSFATAVLILLFHGDTHALIPLFAVGVFMAFTLSQTGMVVHWWKEGRPGWLTSVYIELEPDSGKKVREIWEHWFPDVRLEVVPSPYRSILEPFLEFLDAEDLANNDGQQATVVLPEFVPARWYQAVLHNQTAWLLKAALLYRTRQRGFQQAIIDVPYHLRH